MSLFRFVDPTEGKIVIDSIDITKLGVEDLRTRLTLIPQDVALFAGTLRDNLVCPQSSPTHFYCLIDLRVGPVQRIH